MFNVGDLVYALDKCDNEETTPKDMQLAIVADIDMSEFKRISRPLLPYTVLYVNKSCPFFRETVMSEDELTLVCKAK